LFYLCSRTSRICRRWLPSLSSTTTLQEPSPKLVRPGRASNSATIVRARAYEKSSRASLVSASNDDLFSSFAAGRRKCDNRQGRCTAPNISLVLLPLVGLAFNSHWVYYVTTRRRGLLVWVAALLCIVLAISFLPGPWPDGYIYQLILSLRAGYSDPTPGCSTSSTQYLFEVVFLPSHIPTLSHVFRPLDSSQSISPATLSFIKSQVFAVHSYVTRVGPRKYRLALGSRHSQSCTRLTRDVHALIVWIQFGVPTLAVRWPDFGGDGSTLSCRA